MKPLAITTLWLPSLENALSQSIHTERMLWIVMEIVSAIQTKTECATGMKSKAARTQVLAISMQQPRMMMGHVTSFRARDARTPPPVISMLQPLFQTTAVSMKVAQGVKIRQHATMTPARRLTRLVLSLSRRTSIVTATVWLIQTVMVFVSPMKWEDVPMRRHAISLTRQPTMMDRANTSAARVAPILAHAIISPRLRSTTEVAITLTVKDAPIHKLVITFPMPQWKMEAAFMCWTSTMSPI
jgi:hypothetical protein